MTRVTERDLLDTDPRLTRLRENLTARGWTTLGHKPRQPYEVWTRGDGQRLDGVFDSIVIPVDPTKTDFEQLMGRAYRLAGDTLVLPVEGTAQADQLVDQVLAQYQESYQVCGDDCTIYGCPRCSVVAVLAALRQVTRGMTQDALFAGPARRVADDHEQESAR